MQKLQARQGVIRQFISLIDSVSAPNSAAASRAFFKNHSLADFLLPLLFVPHIPKILI